MNIETNSHTILRLRLSGLAMTGALIATLALAPVVHAQGSGLPAPALRYAPSAPGNSVPNTGTGAGITSKGNPLLLRKNTAPHLSNCATAGLVLDEGTGPFQRGRAIDLSANEVNGGKVTHLAAIPRGDFGGLDACTITLWYRLSGPLPKGAYTTLVRSASFDLLFVSDALAALTYGTTKADGAPARMNAPRNPMLSRENQWLFVALTWDGATGTTAIYYGDEVSRAAVLQSGRLAARGQTARNTTNMAVNFGYHNLTDGGTRAFDGMMADIRFYAAALTPSQIEAVRVGAGQK